MKVNLYAVKSAFTNIKKSRKNMLISFVALVEILLIIVASTFSWVETISSIKIYGDGTIDTFTFTNAKIGYGEGYTGNPIDLSKYFRASGNVHLSSASSADGDKFFFPVVASAEGASSSRYREGNISDKNTNYISFSFNVEAVTTNADFFFDKIPSIKIGDEVLSADNNAIRIAITADNVTKVYSNKAVDSEFVVAKSDGNTVESTKINAFGDFTDNTSEDSSKILFSVPKDTTKKITVTLWLQDPEKTSDYSGKTVTINDFKIVPNGVKTTKIRFSDRTTTFEDFCLTDDDASKMWIYTSNKKAYEMKIESTEDGKPLWSALVVTDDLGDANSELIFYHTPNSVTENPQSNYTHFWKTKLSDADGAVEPNYKAYGSTKSDGKEGYGTWGSVSEIKLFSDNAESVLPKPSESVPPVNVTMTNSASVAVPMNYNQLFWRGYIPKDSNSKDLIFSFTYNNKNYTLNAVNRETTEDASTYGVTSAETGYWEAPARIYALIPSEYNSMGTVSVTGGPQGASTVKVTKGTTVTLKAEPESNDYVFEGWYEDEACTKNKKDSSSFEFTASEAKDYKFYAKWNYNVRLSAKTDGKVGDSEGGTVQINEGTAGATVNMSVEKGGSVKIKANTNTEDYEFCGWYDDQNNLVYDSNQTTVEITNIQEPIDYYAVYKVKTFVLEAYAATNGEVNNIDGGTVKFESETESGAYAKVTVNNNKTAQFQAIVKETDGYRFVGWFSDEACQNLVSSDLNYKADKNTVYKKLYAKFVLKEYDVEATAVTNNMTADSSGGTVKIIAATETQADTTATSKVTHGNTVQFIANEKIGYAFVGWYDAVSGGTRVSSDFTYTIEGVSSDIKIFAIFKEIFTVTLTARTDNNTSNDGGIVQAGSSTAGATSTTEVKYGESVTITATPADASYSFKQWVDENGVSHGGETSKTFTNVQQNIVLYGDFVKKTFTIKAVASDGNVGQVEFTSPQEVAAGTNVEVTVEYNGSATFKANVTNSEYIFKGWYDESNNKVSSDNPYTMNNITASKTLTAKFEINSKMLSAYAVTDNASNYLSGGNVQIVCGEQSSKSSYETTLEVSTGSSVTYKAVAKTGYTFDGWYDAESGGALVHNSAEYPVTVNDSAKLTLYAVFKKTSRRIYFKYDSWSTSASTPIYCYTWQNSNNNNKNANWPGEKMKYDETLGLWYHDLPLDKNYDRIIFNKKSQQTVDITLDNSVNYYEGSSFSGKLSCNKYRRLYFTNNDNWEETIKCYAWDSDGNNASWPGVQMNKAYVNPYGEQVYYINLDKKYGNAIFTNQSEQDDPKPQTIDIDLNNGYTNYFIGTLSDGNNKYNVLTY